MMVRWGRNGPARPREILGFATMLVIALAAFLAWGPAGARANTVVADSAVLLAALAATLAFAWRARRASRPAPWWLLSLAGAVFASAEAYWFVLEVVLNDRVPAATWADVLYYAGYALLVAALVMLFPGRVSVRTRWCRILDVVIVAVGLLALVWMLVLAGPAAQGGLGAGERLLVVAYPVLDLATAGIILVLTRELTGADRQRLLMLGGGLIAWAVADVLYARASLGGTYISGFPFDALWVGGYVLAAASAAIGTTDDPVAKQPQAARDPPSRLGAHWTYLAWAFVLPVTIHHYLRGGTIDGFLFGIGMVLIAATVGRHILLASDLMDAYRGVEAKERQLNAAQTVAGVGSWELCFDTKRLTWSDQTFRIFGLTPGQSSISYDDFFGWVHPDDRQNLRSGFEESVRSHRPYDGEHRILTADGRTKWVHERGEVRYDADDRPVRAIGTVQDIDERKGVERRLRESKERLRNLVENMEECFFSTDVRDPERPRVLYVSHRYEDIYGRPVEGAHAHPDRWLDHVHPDDRGYALGIMDRLAHSAAGLKARYRIVRPDGSIRTVEMFTRPIRDDEDKLVRLDGFVRDVTTELALAAATERAREQELEAARLRDLDELKTTFLNTAAHELATPLTSIKIQLAIMNATHPDDAGFALLTRNVERLERLVRDLMDASRLQAGRMSIHPAPRELYSVIQDVVAAARIQASHADISLHADVPHDLEVEADELRINQVINNLLNNAIKFTPEGGRITITARPEADMARIDITDSGAGLDPDKSHLLFRPFQQAHTHGGAPEAGTGLGLFISRGIIERHGGTIEAASPGLGKGATFTIRLPRVAAVGDDGRRLERPTSRPTSSR